MGRQSGAAGLAAIRASSRIQQPSFPAAPTVIAAALYRHSGRPYRHSRVSGNPEMPDGWYAGLWQNRPGFPLTRE